MNGEPNWGWYASANEENYNCGPEASRDAIIKAAIADEVGLKWDEETGKVKSQSFHIVEAYQAEIELADSFNASDWLDGVNDSLSEFGSEDGEPLCDLSSEQTNGLQEAVRKAISDWQAASNVKIKPWVFTGTRNGEVITLNEVGL